MSTMKKKLKFIMIGVVLSFTGRVAAQDVIYSQFYANPIYLNPALAGGKLCSRLTLNYRNQWPTIRKGYTTYSATWDQYYEGISGSVAVMANANVGGGGLYNTFQGSGVYSYRLQASKYLVFNAAVQAGYLQYRLDWNKLVFGDQIDVNTGNLEPTREYLPPKLNIGTVDFSAGLLGGYKESHYFGIAVNHLNRPDVAFYDGNENRLKLRWTIHWGILIDFFQGMDGEDIKNFSISPNIVYEQQGNFRQLNLGVYMNKYPFVYGAWFRHAFGNPDSFIVLLGFQQKNFKIGYSFDYTVSRLSIASGGAHEVSMVWLFHKYLDRDRYHEMRSPSF